ncbi:hypothetical protein JHK82_037334 [Glycine max]|uniref:Uncharacterized protein n=1 Tax=Glycine max TaxID=3847 RepID=K7M207_SOYBN|nr:hypothetical protein JHK85_038088 [Glycine max]KAG5114065.1 hypothetical protein JHK82_037334 [Glycine max]KAH1103448.1 hypothetical protein GYH30_037412 [Glycine max]KRH21818.1 hypothetical protein GLYMA_13G260700v4 [Glycine max]
MEILFSSSSLSIPRLNISFFSFCSSPWKELSKCSLLSSPKQILRTSKRRRIKDFGVGVAHSARLYVLSASNTTRKVT